MVSSPSSPATAGHPPIRTFHGRHGRMTDVARAILADDLADHALDRRPDPSRPLVVEVGAGSGIAARAFAKVHSDCDLVACEVHPPGVAQTLRVQREEPLANLYVHHGDALELLDTLPDASVVAIHVFFPDPWPKARHHKRRFIRPDILERCARVLLGDGGLRLATDIDDYAAWAEEHVAGHGAFDGPDRERPTWRPITAYERRGLDAGHRIHDLAWTRLARR